MSNIKTLYKGMFQTRKRVFIERAYAYTEKQAWVLFVRRIAKKQGIKYLIVADWFKDPENYAITPEIEFKEID